MAIMPSLLGLGGCDMEAWVPVVAALITGPTVVVLQRLRKENTEQHNQSRGILDHILYRIEKINDKFDEHINDHYKENV
jgi:hypothetical protein